jgi:hypothetical protein
MAVDFPGTDWLIMGVAEDLDLEIERDGRPRSLSSPILFPTGCSRFFETAQDFFSSAHVRGILIVFLVFDLVSNLDCRRARPCIQNCDLVCNIDGSNLTLVNRKCMQSMRLAFNLLDR